jgi:hypothetical protein
VHWVESQSQSKDLRTQRPVSPPIDKLVQAAEDIEHGASGKVTVLKGNAVFSAMTPWTDQELEEVYNPGQKVWSGTQLIVSRVSLAQATAGQAIVWYVTKAWSATRVRGKTTSSISAGGTGSVTVTQAIDGQMPTGTITAYLPTEFVTVAADRVVWAELVYRTTGSRWEIYSADCDGA